MRVYGEAYFCLNMGMDFLCLLLAARLGRLRFRPGRALLAAGLGGGYALLALMGPPWLGGAWGLMLSALCMCLLAFGRRGLRGFPLLLAVGLFFWGVAEYFRGRRAPAGLILAGCAFSGLGLAALLLRRGPDGEGRFEVELRLGGRRAVLPALRDSGNLLADPVSGLPVIVIPAPLARSLLPPGTRPERLDTLPPGGRLIRMRTAGGVGTAMLFCPDEIILRQGGAARRVDAMAAAAPFRDCWALLPEALFSNDAGPLPSEGPQERKDLHAGF